MNLATLTDRDIIFTEVGTILQMVQSLTRDIDNGKEPDEYPFTTIPDQKGKKMTLKRARIRLAHVQNRLGALTQQLSRPA